MLFYVAPMKKAKSLTKRNETSVSFPTPLYRRVSKYCNNTRVVKWTMRDWIEEKLKSVGG
jgi:hypothetical protein